MTKPYLILVAACVSAVVQHQSGATTYSLTPNHDSASYSLEGKLVTDGTMGTAIPLGDILVDWEIHIASSRQSYQLTPANSDITGNNGLFDVSSAAITYDTMSQSGGGFFEIVLYIPASMPNTRPDHASYGWGKNYGGLVLTLGALGYVYRQTGIGNVATLAVPETSSVLLLLTASLFTPSRHSYTGRKP